MTDRELLELAAKAAGIHIDKSPHNGGGHGNTGFDSLGNAVLDWHNNKRWNPLADDGDALRLAVKLHITVVVEGDQPDDIARRTKAVHRLIGDRCESHRSDPRAATRRAIVRAAAEIGKMG